MVDLKLFLEDIQISKMTGKKKISERVINELRPHMIKFKPNRPLSVQRIAYGLFEEFISDRANSSKHGYINRTELKEWWKKISKKINEEELNEKLCDIYGKNSNYEEELLVCKKEIEKNIIENIFSLGNFGTNKKIMNYVVHIQKIRDSMKSLSENDFEEKSQILLSTILNIYKENDKNYSRLGIMVILNKMKNPWDIFIYMNDLSGLIHGYDDLENFFINDIQYILASISFKDNIDFSNKEVLKDFLHTSKNCLLTSFIAFDNIRKYENFKSENWKTAISNFTTGLRKHLNAVASLIMPSVRDFFPFTENIQKNTIVVIPDFKCPSEEIIEIVELSMEILNICKNGGNHLGCKHTYDVILKEIEFLFEREIKMRIDMINNVNKNHIIEHLKITHKIIKKIERSDTMNSIDNRIIKTLNYNGVNLEKESDFIKN